MKTCRFPIFLLCAYILFSAGSAFADSDRLSACYHQGRFDEAVDGYRIAAQGGELKASLDLAVILKDLGNYDEAISVLRRSQAHYGKDPALLSILARLYYLNGKNPQALKVLADLEAVAPNNIEASVLAGLCHEALGEDDAARLSYEKVVSLDKNNVIARLSLAQLYYRQKRLRESAENFQKVSILDSSIRKVYGCWADVLFQLGNYREAFRIYEKLRLIDPRNEAVRAKVERARAMLGPDFFKDQHEKIVESRKGKTLLVKPALQTANVRRVSVGLLTGCTGKVKFKCPVAFVIKDSKGAVYEGTPNALYSIAGDNDNVTVTDDAGKTVADAWSCDITPSRPEGCLMFFAIKTGGSNFWADLQDRSFRGTVTVRSAAAGRTGFDMINKVSLEEYLYSVIPSEMPSSWPIEALKAQAVAARSEAMFKLGRHKKDGFDFCAEVHCQSYYGIEKETETSREAVDQTCGIIMTYGDHPVDAIYSSTCGGHTQDNIFGGSEAVGYLKGRPDTEEGLPLTFPLSPFELENWLRNPPKGVLCDIPEYLSSSSFRWVRVYSAGELKQLIGKTKPIGNILKVLVSRRNRSGHVEALRIKGSEDSLSLEKELVIRKALGDLRSSLFKVEVKFGPDKSPEQFIFYGGGWGHGVGMCQAGACGLAAKGKGYKEILRHYFSRVDFDRLY